MKETAKINRICVRLVLFLVVIGAVLGEDKPETTTWSKEQMEELNSDGPKSVTDFMKRPVMTLAFKTPGRCEYVGHGSDKIVQSLTGEHQDFVLGELMQDKLRAFLEEAISREKNVYALGTKNSCHWSSLQNMFRGLFLNKKEADINKNASSDILLPPGFPYASITDKTVKKALPNGFWPVAIRSDNLENILFDNITKSCPVFDQYIKDETVEGIFLLLQRNQPLMEKFIFLKNLLINNFGKNYLETPIEFDKIEDFYQEIQRRNLDLQLSPQARSLLLNFYWLFLYAKYTSSEKILLSLVKPTVDLMVEKMGYLGLDPSDTHHSRDKLMVLSVSDKLMAGLNSFFFRYSHECFLSQIIAQNSETKNLCPGKVYPTSNVIMRIDQFQLEQTITAFIGGQPFVLCRMGGDSECKLDHFLKMIELRLKEVLPVTCREKEILIIEGFWDKILAKLTFALFLLVFYYSFKLGRFMLSSETKNGPAVFYHEGQRVPSEPFPDSEITSQQLEMV